MARMIPDQYVDYSNSKAEELIFNILKKNLDDNWTIFYSYNLFSWNEREKASDAEIDFLLFNPFKGMLVLEVKGGTIEYKNGMWMQNGNLQKDFVKQVLKNKYAIETYLLKRLYPDESNNKKYYLPFALAHALCFPDCFLEIKGLPGGCEDILINGRQLPYIDTAIESILKRTNRNSIDLDKQQAKFIISLLLSEFKYGTSICDKIGQEERIFFSLTEEQGNLLEFIDNFKTALINGCAGSGKTILAIKKARQLASAGNAVLLICYNALLSHYMEKEVEGLKDKITVGTYHNFCLRQLRKLNCVIPGNPADEAYWNVDIPVQFEKQAVKSIAKYDAIIVDEGQDFMDFYWISISDLLREGGYFFIFYDEQQNIYNRELNLPPLSTPFRLTRNCRNTREIFDKILPYSSGKIKLHDKVPQGMPVTELQGDTPKLRRNHLSRILHDLVENQSVKESEIVILGGHSFEHTSLSDDPVIGKFTISKDNSYDDHVIPYYTYMKFKGCESPVVILLDVCESDPRWNKEGLLTAMTRAKHLLYIIRK